MLRIKTQFLTKIPNKTDPSPLSMHNQFFNRKTEINCIIVKHINPSPRGRLLQIDFDKIHDKSIKVIFLIIKYKYNQKLCIYSNKKLNRI